MFLLSLSVVTALLSNLAFGLLQDVIFFRRSAFDIAMGLTMTLAISWTFALVCVTLVQDHLSSALSPKVEAAAGILILEISLNN